jgi:hypothetical protein
MTMRSILIVGVKLIGVMVLYWALQHIPGLLYNVAFFLDKPPSEVGYISPGWQLAASCLSFLFAVTFGTFLLFRGEVFAARLPLSESSFELPDIKAEQLLGLAIIVAGLLIASNALPRFLLEVYILLISPHIHAPNSFMFTLYGRIRPFESVLQLTLAGMFIFRSASVVRLVTRYGLGTDTTSRTNPLHSDARQDTRG